MIGWTFPLLPERASTMAGQVDLLYWALIAFSALILLAVFGMLLWFSFRYRAGRVIERRWRGERSLKVELAFGGAMLVTSLGLFAWSGVLYFDLRNAPKEDLSIYVVGKQWMWKVQHPGGRREINTLHVPVGRVVKVVLTSQDVIHSFYLPAFRIKQDALPNRYTDLWFEATKPGVYPLYCAEYCGTEHGAMRGTVVVMEPGDYQRWLEDAPDSEAPETPGAPGGAMAAGDGIFFRLGCQTCHLPGSSQRAPRLDGLFGHEVRLANGETLLADEQYLRESILYPNAKISAGYDSPSLMPTFHGLVTEGELAELVEFIKGLHEGWPEGSVR